MSIEQILEQQWTAFTTAPYIVAPLIVFAGLVGWWLKGTTIAGLKGRISVFEDRLKLAAQQAESARQAKAEVAKEFETYVAEVAGTDRKCWAWRVSCGGWGRDCEIRGIRDPYGGSSG